MTLPSDLRRAILAAALALSLLAALVTTGTAQAAVPSARDFEQRLAPLERVAAPPALANEAHAGARAGADSGHRHGGDGPHLGHGPVSFRSGTIEAPERFDLAGIAGELRPLELRARQAGGSWGEWIETANGDPAFFGPSDELQIRARGWRPTGRIHYVRITGHGDPAPEPLARRAQGKGDRSAPEPKMIGRKQWGADRRRGGCPPRKRPSIGDVRATVVHHTVSDNNYSRAQVPGVILGICRFHRYGNGWDDIGYNALVDRFGRLWVGRKGGTTRAVIGAHAQGSNTYTAGIAAIGTHDFTPLSSRGIRATARWITWTLDIHGHTSINGARFKSSGGEESRFERGEKVRIGRIVGHRAVGLTACPGNSLNGQLKRLRNKVSRKLEKFDSGGNDEGGGGPGGGLRT